MLKIFFGYAAGVGKTTAMLKAAHTARGQGVDVVVGYVEPGIHVLKPRRCLTALNKSLLFRSPTGTSPSTS